MITRIQILGIGVLSLLLFGGTKAADREVASEATPVALPLHLQWAREHVDQRPPPEVRSAVRPEDKEWLMRMYRNQPKANQRVAFTWMLAYIGDDDVFKLFSDRLRLGPGSRVIETDDFWELEVLLDGMGVMAQTNDLGFRFLTNAISPDWWRKERKWREKREQVGRYGTLASSAVCALGLSARAEAGIIFDRMRKEGCNYVSPNNPRENRNLARDVYTGKRYLEVSRKMGKGAFRDGLFGPEFKRCSMEWRKSEEGMEWFAWCTPKDKFPGTWKNLGRVFEDMERRFD